MFSVNQLRLGTITATDYCLGSIPVQKMYLGSVLVFDRTPVVETKYTFTVPHSTISLPAEANSGNFTLSWESYKQDVINGEVQEAKTKVGVVTNSLDAPDWIQLSSQEEGELGNSLTFTFSNNTTTDERSFTFQLTQQESSKQLTVVVTQSGAQIETTYTWNVTPTTVTIDGTNTATINVTSYKQQWIGDVQQGSLTPIDFQYTNPGLEETIKANKVDNGNGSWTITLSGGQPSVQTTYQMVFTADEGDNSTTVTVNKVAAGRNYGDITITEFTYPDIAPASGSTVTPTLSYTQSWGYGDSTTDGGTITSGATLQFAGGAVNVSNGQYTYASKGKELSEQTDTQVTVTVSLNGKTKTATANASQAANTRTLSSIKAEYNDNTDFEDPAYVADASGKITVGSSSPDKIAAYVNVYKIYTYTSGSTSRESANETTILTDVDWIHDNGKNQSDFIVDTRGTTVGDERTGTVWVVVESKKSNIANVSQEANAITDTKYTEWTITQSNIDSVSAEGQVLTINPTIKRTKTDTYTSKATKQTEETSTDFTLQSNQSWAVVDNKNINVQQNTGDERSATITITSNGKSTTFTITQSTGQTITSYGDITINGGSAADIPASGGTVKASGCTATIKVTYSSGSTGSVTVPAENITYTEVSAASLGTTAKARTKVGTSTCNVSYQGKSASKQIDVYQAANSRNETPKLGWGNYGNWKADASGRITEGSSDDNKHVAYTYLQLMYTYTSGATETVKVEKITLKTDVDWIKPTDYSDFTVNSRSTVVGEERVGNVWFEYEGRSSTKKTVTQAANTVTYAIPVISCTYNDIPASGGSVNPTSSFTQTVSYTSGSSSSVSTGGTWTYINATNTSTGQVTASSKGKTASARTEVKTVTANITINGRTGSKQVVVYQQANVKTDAGITYGTWDPEVNATNTNMPASGGTLSWTFEAVRTRVQKYTYTSGATETQNLSNETTTTWERIELHNYVDDTQQGNHFTIDTNARTVTAPVNTTNSVYSCTVVCYMDEEWSSVKFTQQTGQRQYATPVISEVSMNDVPASGMIAGSYTSDEPEFQQLINSFKVTQTWGYGSTTGGGTETYTWPEDDRNLGMVLINLPTNVPSKGTTTSSRTNTNQQLRLQVGPNLKDGHTMLDLYQEANTRTAGDIQYGEWQVSVSANPNTIDSNGGVRTITRNATRTRTQQYNYTSGATSSAALSNETGTPTLSSNQTWATVDGNNVTIAKNTTTSSRTVTITGTYQSKSDTCTITQSARQVESYGDITISGGSVNGDIPASGGSKSASGCTATIRVNYDNDTYENVNVPSSNISYSSVSGSNLGTTSKARTKVGTSRCTVNYQDKTATKDFDVYQQANSSTAGDIVYGTWQVNVSANPTTIAAGGGTSTITRSASRTRKQNYTWTSGASSQSNMANETATPALSVSGTGFSLAGTTVTATSNIPARTYTLTASNPTGDLEEGPDQELTSNVTSTYTQPSSNARSCTVTATHSGVSKQITISQGGQSQSSGNQDWTVAKGTNMQTATKSGNTILMVPNPEYGNKNETYTATCTVTQTTSNKTATVQGRWYKGYLNVSPATLEFTADGGTDKITIDTNLNWQVMP